MSKPTSDEKLDLAELFEQQVSPRRAASWWDEKDKRAWGWFQHFQMLIEKVLADPERNWIPALTRHLAAMVEKGWDPNAPLLWQDTYPLHRAISEGANPIVECMLKLPTLDLDTRVDYENTTALHQAVVVGNRPAIKMLVEAGMDINVRSGGEFLRRSESFRGFPPLAMPPPDVETLRLLHSLGALDLESTEYRYKNFADSVGRLYKASQREALLAEYTRLYADKSVDSLSVACTAPLSQGD